MKEIDFIKEKMDEILNTPTEVEALNSLLMVEGCVRTSTGKYINYTDINPDDICIEDIAHALSMQCRFGGHLPQFYSVAQHSVHCSELVHPDYALEALLHDASEAYMLDIPKPLKNLLPDYEALEEKMMRTISEKYNITHPLSQPVKSVDAIMLVVEFKSIMLQGNMIEVWSMEDSKRKFIERYRELTRT